VVGSGGSTVGLDARTGETLWEAKDLPAANPSPGLWKNGNQTCVVINSRKLACLDVKTGKVVWEERGGGSSTPAVAGDHLALIIGQKLMAFRLSPQKAEKLWETPFVDDYASVLISGDYVYAVGAAPRNGKEGRAVCVELKTGKVAWDSVVQGGPTCSSPLLADGKIVAYAGGLLTLIRATPEKYTQLGQSPVGGEGYTSPALCDGKLFVRVNNKVSCYDLSKP